MVNEDLDLAYDICWNCLQLVDGCLDCEAFANYYDEEEIMASDVIYQEIGRIRMSDKTEVVVSSAWKDGQIVGYTINDYVRTNKYTGFTKGPLISKAKWAEFKAIVDGIK